MAGRVVYKVYCESCGISYEQITTVKPVVCGACGVPLKEEEEEIKEEDGEEEEE